MSLCICGHALCTSCRAFWHAASCAFRFSIIQLTVVQTPRFWEHKQEASEAEQTFCCAVLDFANHNINIHSLVCAAVGCFGTEPQWDATALVFKGVVLHSAAVGTCCSELQ